MVPRSKNNQALIELGLSPKHGRNIILNLTSKDYIDGPLPDKASLPGTIWIFKKRVNDKDIYIKLKIFNAEDENHATCISFHD